MKLLFIATVAILAFQAVKAHTVFTTLFVDDVNQGDATCIRMNMTPSNSTNPVNDLASNDMACGFDGAAGVARVCPVSQGSKLTFVFREWADASKPGAIDPSHKGPCAVYMKAVASAIKDHGYGDGWFKIWDSGYNSATSQWCTEKLIQDNGLLSVNIPGNIAGGYYLVRPELLALQEADKIPSNPQFYTGCAQIFISTGGTTVPSTVSIPGYVTAADKSVTFNIYNPKFPYPIPGPAVFNGGDNAASKNIAAAAVQTEGLVPAGCVIFNSNWCGVELDSYNTEAGCWNTTTCYGSAAPTGDEGCRSWEAKCTAIQVGCSAGNFNGPPNKGKDLNPPAKAYIIPPAEGTTFSVISAAPAATKSTVQPTTQTASTATGVFTPIILLSTDGRCGASVGQSCLGSKFGDCCSQYDWCGTAQTYCGQGCQGNYGSCGMLKGRHYIQHLHGRLAH